MSQELCDKVSIRLGTALACTVSLQLPPLAFLQSQACNALRSGMSSFYLGIYGIQTKFMYLLESLCGVQLIEVEFPLYQRYQVSQHNDEPEEVRFPSPTNSSHGIMALDIKSYQLLLG